MTWQLTLSGDTDSEDLEVHILTVLRNLVEDVRSSGTSSVSGTFSAPHVGQIDFDVERKPDDAAPPHFGGADVDRDPETGWPIDSDELRAWTVFRQDGGLLVDFQQFIDREGNAGVQRLAAKAGRA